jgi:hypothetical protein
MRLYREKLNASRTRFLSSGAAYTIPEQFFEKQFEPYLEGVAFARHPVFY